MRRAVALLVTGLAVTGCAQAGKPAAGPATDHSAGRPATASPAASRPSAALPSGSSAGRPATTTRSATAVPSWRLARYVYPVARCSSSYSSSHHDYPASDIFTGRGCAFVAVTDGRVDEVSYVDRWDPQKDYGATRGGRSVSIIGADGVRYYGSHLEKIAAGIRPGVRVRAGQLLGLIDNSGDARWTPTHVHFGISWPTRPGIWWVRRGEVWPQRYLGAWRAGRDLSPAREVQRVHTRMGDIPRCQAEC